jgi:hypothetical protein
VNSVNVHANDRHARTPRIRREARRPVQSVVSVSTRTVRPWTETGVLSIARMSFEIGQYAPSTAPAGAASANHVAAMRVTPILITLVVTTLWRF